MTTSIEVEASGVIDGRDCAYPQAIEMPDGSILCSYSNAGGQQATGGTDVSRSTDGGRTWTWAGTVLPVGERPATTNFLKISRTVGGSSTFAYGARLERVEEPRFGERHTEAIACSSADGGVSWSAPRVLDFATHRLEISSPILCLSDGTLLAPAATIHSGRLGERVLVLRSTDGGTTWGTGSTVFVDEVGERGYLEHKFSEVGPSKVVATAWTIRMRDVSDLPNCYAISRDGGQSWSPPRETDLECQTLSTVRLGKHRLLALGNVRTARPGIVASVIHLGDDDVWRTEHQRYVFEPADAAGPRAEMEGLEAMRAFGFGFPTGTRLRDGRILITYWVRTGLRTEVRWARLAVDSSRP